MPEAKPRDTNIPRVLLLLVNNSPNWLVLKAKPRNINNISYYYFYSANIPNHLLMHNNSSFYLLIPYEQYVGDGTTSLCKHDLQVLHRVPAVCKLYSESSEAEQRDYDIPRGLLLLVNDT